MTGVGFSSVGRRLALTMLAVCAGLAVTYRSAEIAPGSLTSARGIHAATTLVRAMWPLASGWDFLAYVGPLVLQTIALSLLGLLLAVVLSLPLVVLATGTLTAWGPIAQTSSPARRWVGRSLYAGSRGVLNAARSVPELAWAIVFVTAVGFGPLAGVLALGITYAGMIGKVLADIFEEVDQRPLEALHAAGATRSQIFLCGVLPQAYPDAVSFILYVWDCTMRAATVLGIVGAGGLGYALYISVATLAYDQFATLLVVMLALVTFTDVASVMIRNAYVRGPVNGVRGGRIGATFPPTWLIGILAVAAAVVSTLYLQVSPLSLFTSDTASRLAAWGARAFPPDLSPQFLRSALPEVWQTLSMGLWSSILAVVAAIPLAIMATSTVILPRRLLDFDGMSAFEAISRRAAYWCTRGLLSLLRAVPEIIWALLAIVVVGPGPFAGVLALTAHTTGVLGRLLADAFENVERRPLEQLAAAGAQRSIVLMFGMLPAALPQLLTHIAYRFEMNVRAATVVGIVGAGGLGQAIYNDAQTYHYHGLVTLVLIVVAIVAITDGLSTAIRRSMS